MTQTSIDQVSFSYLSDPAETKSKKVSGVEDIQLEFAPGSLTLITGASGSGKSTVLKLLNGLIPELFKGELTGKVTLAGLDTTATNIQELGRTAGTVFQSPRSQFFTGKVLEELAFASENAGDPPEVICERIAHAANTWGIPELIDRKLNGLSGGELQLVACAAAVAGPQQIILLDEPTSNLSPAAIERFTATVAALKAQAWTIIVAEHRLYPFRELADKVVIMDQGKVTEQVPAQEFFARDDEHRRARGLRTFAPPQRHYQPDTARPESNGGIHASALKFSYGQKKILDIPELCLPNGTITALTGPNGAGKTTLARVLIGLNRPEKGSHISFNGTEMKRHQRVKHSALVMQDVNRQLFGETVTSEVSLGNGAVDPETVEDILTTLNLADLKDRHPMTLSGGQKQRLVIANALVSKAQLYVFDEPTSGVDYHHLLSISRLIRRLATAGKAVLVISHDLEFINEVADRELELSPLGTQPGAQLRATQAAR